jgi:hypothetical protein
MPWRRNGERRYSSTHSYRGIRWRWLVSFTQRPLYPQGKSPWYPTYMRLGGPQSRSGHCREEKKFSAPAGTRTPDHSTCTAAIHYWAIPAPNLFAILQTNIKQNTNKQSAVFQRTAHKVFIWAPYAANRTSMRPYLSQASAYVTRTTFVRKTRYFALPQGIYRRGGGGW